MTDNHGVAADAAGLSSATPTEPVPVSSVPVSIPNAVQRLITALKPWEDDWRDAGMPDCVPDDKLMLDADGVGGEIITVGHWRELMAALAALRSPCSIENGGWLGPVLSKRVASAIEARSDATGTGTAEGESATAEGRDAQPSPASTPTPESI